MKFLSLQAIKKAGCHYNSCFRGPVAQLDRASDYGSEGLGFESLRVRFFS